MQYNKKVDVLRITSTATSMGISEVVNVLHNNLPCRINWKQGSQRILFDKDSYFRDAVMYCRIVDITTNDRVRFNSVVYEIVDVANDDESNRQLKITLKSVK